MKHKTAILFHSNYGVTKKYAILISENLRCDLYDIQTMNQERLYEYNTFILCSSIVHNTLEILPFLKLNKTYFKDKKAILIVTYMNQNHENYNLDFIFEKEIPVFYKKGHLSRNISFKHLLSMIKNHKYYLQNKELSMLLHQPKKEDLEDIQDILEYCINTLHIEIPRPLQNKKD